jgi:hypothetical protein
MDENQCSELTVGSDMRDLLRESTPRGLIDGPIGHCEADRSNPSWENRG